MNSYILKLGNDVDTDQIIPSQYLLMSIDEMKEFALETVMHGFSSKVKTQSIIVAGENFGCGSSREQAPRVLKELGVKLVIAKSFARIFFRNAINIGLPVVVCESIYENVQDGNKIDVDLENGKIIIDEKAVYYCTKLPEHMTKIIDAGGLVSYLNAERGK